MTVGLDSFVQAGAERIPVPTVITNVVATLRGTQPESANRIYVVSGHYDSMLWRVRRRELRRARAPTTTRPASRRSSRWRA